MSVIDASNANQSVNISLFSNQMDFDFQDDLNGLNNANAYSWITSAGHDIQTTGNNMDFANDPPNSGNVTAIDIDLGANGFNDIEIRNITGVTGGGGIAAARLGVIVDSVQLFFNEIMSRNDDFIGSAFGDTIKTGGGDDIIAGANGNDLAFGGANNDSIDGDAGNDSLFGEAGDDTLNGNAGNDSLDGGTGNDRLNGGAGLDTVAGGAGNDTVLDDDFVTFDDHDGGAGTDWIDYSAVAFAPNAVTIDLQAGLTSVNGGNTEAITNFENARGSQGGETIRGTAGVNIIGGLGGDDLIEGNNGNDQLFGDTGDDDVQGGGGNDLVAGNAGNDLLRGGGGNDTLQGGAGNDTALGGAGNDTVRGESGNDTLSGEAGNDRLEGGTGNDVLTGGAGRDILVGGAGNDRFDFNAVADSPVGANWDVLQAGGGGAAFDLPGPSGAAGDRIDLADLPGVVFADLTFANVAGNTHCFINVVGGAAPEMRIQINDGAAVVAADYVAADFLF